MTYSKRFSLCGWHRKQAFNCDGSRSRYAGITTVAGCVMIMCDWLPHPATASNTTDWYVERSYGRVRMDRLERSYGHVLILAYPGQSFGRVLTVSFSRGGGCLIMRGLFGMYE